MKFSSPIITALAASSLVVNGNAFTIPAAQNLRTVKPLGTQQQPYASFRPTSALSSSTHTQQDVNEEVERLRAMAASLRQEVAEIEEKQQAERQADKERAFSKFDIDHDGELSLDELKAALEKTFKMEVPQERMEKLMQDFDVSGDGKIQMEEFVGVDQLRNRLDAISREERKQALDQAKVKQQEAAEAEKLASQLDLINDKPPTGTDKIVSTLPYLFPLLDGLAFGRFFLEGAGGDSNPVVVALAVLYGLYRSIPLGGFLTFFGLNLLSSAPQINRLVRYNMRQAVFLDIALFVPGLIATLSTLASNGLDLQLPAGVGEIGSDAVFLTLMVAIGYSVVSSLFGKEPDQIPFISKAVQDRMISLENFLDENGNIDPRLLPGNDKEKDNENDKNNKN